MTPGRRRHWCGLLFLAAAASADCGQKGPPLAPLRIVPAAVTDLSARRLGSDIHLRFTIPRTNEDGSSPAALRQVEVYGLTGRPADPRGAPTQTPGFITQATRVATIEVQPPPPAEEGEPARSRQPTARTDPPDDPRPTQGAVVTIAETLTSELMAPIDPAKRAGAGVTESTGDAWLAGRLWPAADAGPQRRYLVVGVNTRGQMGPPSKILGVALIEPPPAPPDPPSLKYTVSEITVGWETPDVLPLPIQPPAPEAVLRATPIVPQPPPPTYNVYEVTAAPAAGGTPIAPLNPAPLAQPPFQDPRVAFGTERCYTVRTVRIIDGVPIESQPSPSGCITPSDIFPPAAPTGLAAVASEGAVSLIWEPNGEPDLAGYLILRGEAPGETLQALTSEPIREATYRDSTVTPGVRYVYAVVAVDTAPSSNRSPESNRVEETAR